LAGIDYLQRKNLKSCNLQKQAFWSIPSTSVLPAVENNSPDKQYFGSLHRMFVNLQPEPQKAGKVKSMENRNVPIYLFHASVNIENCIGLRKKFLGLGLIISVRISIAEVFVLHWSNGRK